MKLLGRLADNVSFAMEMLEREDARRAAEQAKDRLTRMPRQRLHDQERKHPRRRPHDARHVPFADQEAVGIEGRVGPDERRRDHSG